MKTINCWCRNSNCTYNKKNCSIELDMEWPEINEAESSGRIICPECGDSLKVMGEKVFGGLATFSSMSPDEKKRVLKKRSKEHSMKKVNSEHRRWIRENNIN